MPGGGGGAPAVQTSKSEPWDAQKAFLTKGFNAASNIYDSGAPAVYSGQTLASIDPAQTAALNATEQRAMAGNPLVPQAQGALSDTLGGGYLSAGNPYFGAMADQIGDQVTRKYNQAFSGDDASFGSPAHQAALATGLSSALAPLAFQNYSQERGFQNQAIGQAPALAAADYNDFAQLGQVGDARRALAQSTIDDAVSQFNAQQNQPWNALANYMQMIQGNYGGSNTVTQPVQRGSLGAGLLGGGLSGAATGASIGSIIPGIGTGIGALAGGLLGAAGGGLSR